MSLFVKSLGQWRLVHGMEEPGYPVTQTISQREMPEKAGIPHVKPGEQWPLSDTQSGTKKKVVQVFLPQQCKERAERATPPGTETGPSGGQRQSIFQMDHIG